MSASADLAHVASAAKADARPAIELAGVNKWFGALHVLRDVNLSVALGERVVVCGPSGSGKSTMIRCINRLEVHQEGRIAVDGIELTDDVRALDAIRREVGMVFQSFNLFPHLTVLENCTLAPIWVRRMPKKDAEELAMELLARVKIPEQAKKYPGQLSGGQQQRVALARALAAEPGLLLLDEPLSALDAIVRLHLRQEIRALQQRLGVTTIMVTHDQEEALSVSDRIVVMSQGRIEQIGTPEEVYSQPASAFIAGFIGRSAHFTAKVHTPSGHIAFKDLVMPASAAGHLLYGEAVEVFIRPEDVELTTTADQGAACFSATVTGCEFLGPVCRIALEARGLRFEADVPPATFAELKAHPGSELMSRFRPDRLLIFPSND